MYLLLDLLHPVLRDPAAGFETAPALGGAGAAALLNNCIAQRVFDLALHAVVRTGTLADVQRVTAVFTDEVWCKCTRRGLFRRLHVTFHHVQKPRPALVERAVRAIFAVEVLMLLQMGRIPTAFLQKLCDILCGVLFGFIETRAARKRIANLDVNAVRVAVALPRSKRTSVQRDTNDDFLVIDRRVKRRRVYREAAYRAQVGYFTREEASGLRRQILSA